MWKFALPLVTALALSAQDGGRLTLAGLYHPAQKVSYVEPLGTRYLWRPDGTLLEERSDPGGVVAVNRLQRPFRTPVAALTRAQLGGALAKAGADPAAAGAVPVWNGARDAFVLQGGGELFLVDLATVQVRRLGAGEAPAFSPDGAWVAFLEGNDLRAVEVATGARTRLTTGGDATHLNGRLDWIYQEEVFNERGNVRGFWWAPDSRRLAFLALDETPVPTYTLMDDRTQPQKASTVAYPKAGDPLPIPRLGVAALDGQVSWVDAPYPGQEVLIPRVGWDPQGRLVAHFTDRTQTWVDCRVFEGAASRTLVQERSATWVDPLPLPHFLKDGRFLWQSARTGFTHLYLYGGQGGPVPVTQGDWDVRRLLGVAEGRVYFEATQRSAVGLDAYRAELGGVNLQMRRLTEAPGTHALTFNPAFTAAVDRWSDVETPPADLFMDGEGVILHTVPSKVSTAFRNLRKGRVTFQQVRTRDGFPMETMLVLPPDFDPARKYPVCQYVYGGPNSPSVKNAYGRSTLWYQFLAQQGIVTWICDNRSASAKGAAAHGIYRNLGAQELRDLEDGLAWLKAQGFADPARVALEGYSYGGFLTAYALTHSRSWKLGLIGAPVTDWRLYDAVYTERYMGLPADNAAGYDASSAIKAAGKLGGKVMLIHGTLDGNVHPQNTVQFLDALQKAGFTAPLVLMPGSDHSPRAPQHVWAMYEGMWSFLQANL